MKNEARAVEMHTAKWFSVVYREEVHEKAQKESVVFSLELSMVNKEANEGWRFAADAELPMKVQGLKIRSWTPRKPYWKQI